MLKRTGLFLLIVVTTVVSIEVSLRLLEAALTLQRHHLNSDAKVSSFRILVLGESTSADGAIHGVKSWPRLLEAQLRAVGLSVKVINEARQGTNTTAILKRLPAQLDLYQPDLVIAMMGINDESRVWPKDNGLIERDDDRPHLRIFKLYHYLRWMISQARPPNPEEAVFASPLEFPDSKALILQILNGVNVEQEIDQFLKEKSALQHSQFYAYLAQVLTPPFPGQGPSWPWGPPIPERKDAELALSYHKKALHHSFLVYREVEMFLRLATLLKRPDDCQWVAKSLVQQGIAPSELALHRIRICLPKEYNLGPLFELANLNMEYRQSNLQSPARTNYRRAVSILDERNICFVAIQYPLLSPKSLEQYFASTATEAQIKKPLIVSNESNFAALLSTRKYEEIFIDRFAGRFGHATPLGNQTIADQVASQILPLIKSGTCQTKN